MSELFYVPLEELRRIRKLDVPDFQRISLLSLACRINTLYMITCAGSGHIGSSFSSLDIVLSLWMKEMTSPNNLDGEDIYFSSKGHDAPALYSILIALEKIDFKYIHKLRRLGGLPGHPDIETPYMITNTGSLGMGISKARGMAIANRLKGIQNHYYVLTGDGELQEGQIWESLQPTANGKFSEITVIVDHNKLQSDTWVEKVNSLGQLEEKFRAFGWAVARCDGHDLKALSQVFTSFRDIHDRPQILIADTIKGAGVSFMEHTALGEDEVWYRFHSGSPKQDHYYAAISELQKKADQLCNNLGVNPIELTVAPTPPKKQFSNPQHLVKAYGTALVEQARKRKDIVVLDGDLVLDCGIIPFKEEFPDRFIECGIAEQDMVSTAGGIALNGLLPIVHSFACFLSARPNEQIYNNATEKTKIIYVGSLAGLIPGTPGHSHQSVRDIATLSAIPGLILIEPSCEEEVKLSVDYCINSTHESSYLRLVTPPCDIAYKLPKEYLLNIGEGVILTQGTDAVLFSSGPIMLSESYRAAELLRTEKGIKLTVVNLPWLNRINASWLKSLVKDYQWIFTLDNHYLMSSQSQMIAATLAELNLSHSYCLERFGVERIPVCGQNDEVLAFHQLNAEHLKNRIANTIASFNL